MSERAVVDKFKQQLMEYTGQTYISSGDEHWDYMNIISTVSQQGYWSATALRLYFDDKFNVVKTERRF
jgi:hypothetical protein